MSKLAKALTAAAGNAGESLYVEDVFSTYLYTGTGSAQTITNGIDLDGEGGLVWIKKRGSGALKHLLYDTERGIYKDLNTNDTSAEDSASNNLTAFNSNGFSIGDGSEVSSSSDTRASWTFRKAEKFFDVVTYTGNGVAGRTVAHNLGSTPAVIIVKRTNAVQGWAVYHVGMDATNPENWMMRLNSTDARSDLTPSRWNDTAPTSTDFTLSDNNEVNGNGDTYVAYLFASDAGGFGDDGSENIIKCGSYTVDGSGYSPNVELGFEPQWVLMKPATVSGTAWVIMDTMRGWVNNGTAADDANLRPNVSDAEAVNDIGWPYSTGFYAGYRGSPGSDWIYIAIRRPMKTPESGTEVFSPIASTSTPPTTSLAVGFPADFLLQGFRTYGISARTNTRLTGGSAYLETANTTSEASGFGGEWDLQDDYAQASGVSTGLISYMFKRATGFFDVVAYTGTGVARTVNHNLAAVPDLMIFKQRDIGGYWMVYPVQLGNKYLVLQLTNAVANGFTGLWNNASPTASTFPLGTGGDCNQNGGTYVAYLFATLAGVSKVGSYTGTGADLNVDCGFSAGARFILIKRTDSTGDWYVWDSARGIAAGNDPYLLLNSTAAEVTSTDYIDPLSSGFTVTSSAPAALNASGGTYIFLAIA
jgi:hypothetical protein